MGRRPIKAGADVWTWVWVWRRSEWAVLTFALVPRGQRWPVGHGGGGEVCGRAVHLVGEGAVGQTLLLVPLADEARQGELVMGGEAGGVAEALRPRGAILLDGTGLQGETRQRMRVRQRPAKTHFTLILHHLTGCTALRCSQWGEIGIFAFAMDFRFYINEVQAVRSWEYGEALDLWLCRTDAGTWQGDASKWWKSICSWINWNPTSTTLGNRSSDALSLHVIVLFEQVFLSCIKQMSFDFFFSIISPLPAPSDSFSLGYVTLCLIEATLREEYLTAFIIDLCLYIH